MRCTYLSDLHFESEEFLPRFRGGDVVIVAGDLCHARCLDPERTDKYSVAQRTRVLRFVEAARGKFTRVLLIAGNHEHYDGVFQDTHGFLRQHLPGVTVLENECVEIDGRRFFGSTLWSDFAGRSAAVLATIRRRMGEYFFVKMRAAGSGIAGASKFRPEDALAAHDIALAALRASLAVGASKKTIVITHHAPSRLGANPVALGNGLDGAYFSELDREIGLFDRVPVWVHGHTHVARSYRIGATVVRSNARGFASKVGASPGFTELACFDV